MLNGLVRLHAAIARGLLVDERAALRQRVSELTESRTAAGEAEAHTLRRLERDLHDGPQQRLVRLGMDISSAQRRMETDPERAKELLDEAFQQSQEALAEIRTLSRGIAPPILVEQGLPAAITALAARDSVPTTVDVGAVTLSRRRPERGLLRGRRVADQHGEAQCRHAAAASRSTRSAALVVIAVTDDGVGGASLVARARAGRPGRPAGGRRRHVDGHLAGRRSDPDLTATIPALRAS